MTLTLSSTPNVRRHHICPVTSGRVNKCCGVRDGRGVGRNPRLHITSGYQGTCLRDSVFLLVALCGPCWSVVVTPHLWADAPTHSHTFTRAQWVFKEGYLCTSAALTVILQQHPARKCAYSEVFKHVSGVTKKENRGKEKAVLNIRKKCTFFSYTRS